MSESTATAPAATSAPAKSPTKGSKRKAAPVASEDDGDEHDGGDAKTAPAKGAAAAPIFLEMVPLSAGGDGKEAKMPPGPVVGVKLRVRGQQEVWGTVTTRGTKSLLSVKKPKKGKDDEEAPEAAEEVDEEGNAVVLDLTKAKSADIVRSARFGVEDGKPAPKFIWHITTDHADPRKRYHATAVYDKVRGVLRLLTDNEHKRILTEKAPKWAAIEAARNRKAGPGEPEEDPTKHTLPMVADVLFFARGHLDPLTQTVDDFNPKNVVKRVRKPKTDGEAEEADAEAPAAEDGDGDTDMSDAAAEKEKKAGASSSSNGTPASPGKKGKGKKTAATPKKKDEDGKAEKKRNTAAPSTPPKKKQKVEAAAEETDEEENVGLMHYLHKIQVVDRQVAERLAERRAFVKLAMEEAAALPSQHSLRRLLQAQATVPMKDD